MITPAILALEDGSCFQGQSIGADGEICGEVVFNTSMTGYQEMITDPSYSDQILTFTYPHIGNTGIAFDDNESSSASVSGIVIRDLPVADSNWRRRQSLSDYLISSNKIAISGVDTRRLTRLLREKGAQSGCIVTGYDAQDKNTKDHAIKKAGQYGGLKGKDLAREVTTHDVYMWEEGVWCRETNSCSRLSDAQWHVVAYDFGVKRNILRMLAQRGCRITVVPATTSASDVLAMKPDGVFLSNGPGDPEPCSYAIQAIQEILLTGIPLFGICLGHQLLALACGAKTEKMKFGHHGANHPVQDLKNGKVLITSQNHGFSVLESSLPDTLQATHRSLFDGSLQGIERSDGRVVGFQGHPEASPGPHDVAALFDRFVASISQHAH
ncbi:Carbamoyl-phosphate synthase small chain [invertebrate metagenome]|uniref:carbamoyl-phosphate synthase (glutamine-hydrolyzing) n=1 Tax=invertebrate metagenome TaxID=1711999 RepID=A0A2H9T9J5_9ZZZZ